MNQGLGNLLKNRRERTGLTQEELAQELSRRHVESASRETVSRQERGAVEGLAPDMVNALAEILPVTVMEICEAIGYRVGDTRISLEAGELVALYNWVRTEEKEGFLVAVRALAQGLNALPRRPR